MIILEWVAPEPPPTPAAWRGKRGYQEIIEFKPRKFTFGKTTAITNDEVIAKMIVTPDGSKVVRYTGTVDPRYTPESEGEPDWYGLLKLAWESAEPEDRNRFLHEVGTSNVQRRMLSDMETIDMQFCLTRPSSELRDAVKVLSGLAPRNRRLASEWLVDNKITVKQFKDALTATSEGPPKVEPLAESEGPPVGEPLANKE